MGEIAEMMLDGALCEGCGVYLGGGTSGFTSRCSSCSREAKAITKADNIARSAAKQAASKKIRCTVCNKRVSTVGMADHMRDVHGGAKAPTSMSLTTTPAAPAMLDGESKLAALLYMQEDYLLAARIAEGFKPTECPSLMMPLAGILYAKLVATSAAPVAPAVPEGDKLDAARLAWLVNGGALFATVLQANGNSLVTKR